MNRIHRRSLLARAGVGAAAAWLSPLTRTLVAEAQGNLTKRQRFVMLTFSNGNDWDTVGPAAYAGSKAAFGGQVIVENADLPAKYAALAPWKGRLVNVDGLVNQQGGGGHLCGYDIACVQKASKGDPGSPGGQTFDEHVAGVIGKGAPLPIIHLGARTWRGGLTNPDVSVSDVGIFARGRGQASEITTSPKEAYRALFGDPGAKAGTGAPRTDLLESRKVLDYASEDVKRLRAQLAGAERAKLEQYLGAVEDMQKRLFALETSPGATGKCGAPLTDSFASPEAVFAAQVEIATAALVCGLTNVATVSFMGLGFGMGTVVPQVVNGSKAGGPVSLHGVGHGALYDLRANDQFTAHHAKLFAGMLGKLDGIKEGDQTILESAVAMFTSDNAEQHHARGWRWPLVLVGEGGGKLKTGGRYVRYPTRGKTAQSVPTGARSDQRALGDLFSTLAVVFDTPGTSWGKDGLEATRGPLTELL
jgi:hypothetical protein